MTCSGRENETHVIMWNALETDAHFLVNLGIHGNDASDRWVYSLIRKSPLKCQRR